MRLNLPPDQLSSFNRIVPAINSAIGYSFTDEQPLHGFNYYRSSQAVHNGSVNHHSIHLVKFDSSKQKVFFVSPDPIRGQFHIKPEQEENGPVSFMFINSSGALIKNGLS